MNVSELRSSSVADLSNELNELRKEFFKLNVQKATGQLTQTHKLKQVKKQIAVVKTVMTEKKRVEE